MSKPSLVSDQMKSDTMNKLSTSCGTDMFPGMFAMDPKLVRSSERRDYEPKEQVSDDDKLDDDTDNYKNIGKVPHNLFKSQHSDRNSDKSEKEPEKQKEKQKEKYSDKQDRGSTEEQSYKETSSAGNTADKTQEKEGVRFDEDDESTWTKEELMIRKLEMFRKLGELTQSGVKLSQNYTLDSDYKDMKFEHDLHVGIRAKRTTLNWASKMMIGIVQGIELMNDNFNPFDMKFEDQWSNSVKHDIKDYYDVLGEIYEKYSTPGKKMSPELKLFLMLSGSAVSIQLFKGARSTSSELDKDADQIKKLRKMAQNGDNDNNDENSDNRSKGNKSSEKSSGFNARQALDNKMEKEHENAMKKAADLRYIDESRREMMQYQKMLEKQNMAKMAHDMRLSDTVGSVKSNRSKQSKQSKQSTQSKSTNGDDVMDFEEYNKQLKLNEQLTKAQNLMKMLQDEDNLTKQFGQQVQQPIKQRVLKNTEDDRQQNGQIMQKIQPNQQVKQQVKQQAKQIKSKSPESESDTESESSDSSDSSSSESSVSVNSSSSSVSVRSDRSLQKLLGQVGNISNTNNTNNTSKQNVETKSSISSRSKSTKSSIIIDSDDIRQSDKGVKTKQNTQQIKRASDKELTFEAISLGKASNDSASTSKRGRPRKNQAPMRIQVGK